METRCPWGRRRKPDVLSLHLEIRLRFLVLAQTLQCLDRWFQSIIYGGAYALKRSLPLKPSVRGPRAPACEAASPVSPGSMGGRGWGASSVSLPSGPSSLGTGSEKSPVQSFPTVLSSPESSVCIPVPLLAFRWECSTALLIPYFSGT